MNDQMTLPSLGGRPPAVFSTVCSTEPRVLRAGTYVEPAESPEPAGSGFECMACGRCCRGRGFLPLREGEAERLAAASGCGDDPAGFVRARHMLRQLPGSRWAYFMPVEGECPFLTREGLCSVYSVRPSFCRDYPERCGPEERRMALVKCPLDRRG